MRALKALQIVNTVCAGLSDPTKSPGENYYYFTVADQTAADVYTAFMLPPGVTCTRCVLQWRWVTGNSCYGEGLPRDAHAVVESSAVCASVPADVGGCRHLVQFAGGHMSVCICCCVLLTASFSGYQ